MKLTHTATYSAIALIALLVSPATHANFKKNQIAKVGAVTCGFAKSWFPVSRSGKNFIKIKKPTAAQKAACKTLLIGSKVSLTKLPNLSKIAASSSSSAQVVTGIAPTLSEILTSGPTSTFWRPGVVSSIATGSPTPGQCGEFFSGQNDGESGGFLACYLTQNSGFALSEIVRAGTTMCYLKNMPTAEVLRSGGMRVVRGALPSGGISSLFSTPSGSTPKIVKIGLSSGGEDGGASTGILKVFAADQIAASGDLYKYEMVFCEGDSRTPQEVEKTRITSAGAFISNSANVGGGGEGSRFTGTVTAFLRAEGGSFIFDSSRPRSASFSSTTQFGGETFSNRSEVVISEGNELSNKEYSLSSRETRKAYSVSAFSGSGVTSIRFLEGAIKQSFASGDFNGATEFRDSVYLSAPANRFVSSLSTVDLQTDPFFSGTPEPESITASVTCSTPADIEVEVTMENDSVRLITAQCESERLDGDVRFCSSQELEEAQNRFNSVCSAR
jgi:hypothetical protein